MPQTAVSMAQVVKEAWTADRLQKQYEDKNLPLGKIEALRGVMIGRQAQTPVWGGRSGAFTTVGAGGGSLNPPLQQPVAQALWTLVYNWFQIALDTSALAQASGQSLQSVVGAKDLEIEGAVENTKHQMTRMAVTNGDGIVAAAGTTASSTTIPLTAAAAEGTAYGYSSLVRGWLFPNMPVDIGTTGDSDALATEAVISAVDYSNPAAPTVTLPAAIATTAGTHFFYIPNPNSPTASSTRAQRAPSDRRLRRARRAELGHGRARSSGVARSATSPPPRSRSTCRSTCSATSCRTPTSRARTVWTSYRQQANFYALLQNQVQFARDQNLGAGNVSGPKWNGMSGGRVRRHPRHGLVPADAVGPRSRQVGHRQAHVGLGHRGLGPVVLLAAGHDAVRRRARLPDAARRPAPQHAGRGTRPEVRAAHLTAPGIRARRRGLLPRPAYPLIP
jgi:hypothetical protein